MTAASMDLIRMSDELQVPTPIVSTAAAPRRLPPDISDKIAFVAGGYEFRESGHVFNSYGDLLGSVAYLRQESLIERAALEVWRYWLGVVEPKRKRRAL